MKWTEEEKRQFILRVDIGRARRLYDEGKNAEEIAAVVRRPVALMEKWITGLLLCLQGIHRRASVDRRYGGAPLGRPWHGVQLLSEPVQIRPPGGRHHL